MNLVVVRHGETDFNKSGKLQGRREDLSLNTEGKTQANDLADMLAQEKVDAIFSSPLKRARKTADVIAKKVGMKITEKEELSECDFGSLSGKTWKEVAKIAGKDMEYIDKTLLKYDYRPYGGESATEVKSRLTSFLRELKKTRHRNVILVTHGGIIRLLHKMLGEDIELNLKSASIHEFVL
ncbi:MAG: histidine phosphatase family protein [Patescibacteria group bacterium]